MSNDIPGIPPAVATPPNDPPLTGEAVNAALEKFIFKSDMFTNEVVPRRLNYPDVVRFLETRLEKDVSLKVARQAEKVIVFYDVQEITGKLKSFLDRRETGTEQVQRSIAFTRAIARVGRPEDIEFARQYYLHLIPRADSAEEFEDLVRLYEALGSSADSSVLRQQLIKKKEAFEEDSPEYSELEKIASMNLVQAEATNKIKSGVLNIADRNQRIDAEIKIYLTLEYEYLLYLQPWVGMRLRREGWARDAAQQIQRPENPQNQSVLQGFRRLLEQLDALPIEPPEEKDFVRIRALRAISFFGGALSEEERAFLNSVEGQQMDMLANEGFMLPK